MITDTPSTLCPFHLAFPVDDLDAARTFYGELLGCAEGRSSSTWIDFDFFGHQIVAHHGGETVREKISNPVDGHDVPIPHFGVVLHWEQWQALSEKLKAADVAFVIEPCIRFAGQTGEQATMFFLDPSGNALEFKAFRNPDELFKK
jgi:extradiol dioxygenase family protein